MCLAWEEASRLKAQPLFSLLLIDAWQCLVLLWEHEWKVGRKRMEEGSGRIAYNLPLELENISEAWVIFVGGSGEST